MGVRVNCVLCCDTPVVEHCFSPVMLRFLAAAEWEEGGQGVNEDAVDAVVGAVFRMQGGGQA